MPCVQVIREPKPRSARWLSTSIPEAQWQGSLARMCSAEYSVNNLVSPVLFQEALCHVPEHAVVVEIAPHALLQVRPRGARGREGAAGAGGLREWASGGWEPVRKAKPSAPAGRPEERPQAQLRHHPPDEEGAEGQPGVLPQEHGQAASAGVGQLPLPGAGAYARLLPTVKPVIGAAPWLWGHPQEVGWGCWAARAPCYGPHPNGDLRGPMGGGGLWE